MYNCPILVKGPVLRGSLIRAIRQIIVRNRAICVFVAFDFDHLVEVVSTMVWLFPYIDSDSVPIVAAVGPVERSCPYGSSDVIFI